MILPSSKTNSPDENIIAINRMTFGATDVEINYVNKYGFKIFVENQLNPDNTNEENVNEKIANTKLHIKYDAKEGKYSAMNEDRVLGVWNYPIEKLWPLYRTELPDVEKYRAVDELRVVSWIKAVYSQWQLQELMVEFWHNHFNVTASNPKISSVFPVYDRDVIRKNCFGNFRTFLEDVAKSSAMLYYLNNAASKASPANENFARELFELHTLGSDNYLNNLYNRWREVPGATSGKPIGYIDEDVYEAARAFTGWTVADGSANGQGGKFADTGTFYYHDGWHDNYQKRVLGVEFDPNQAPMTDGHKVLDLVAYHPATAKHLCLKLCKKLISENPPQHLVKGATDVWIKNKNNPNQIKETLRYILLSNEMMSNWGEKVKTPFEMIASVLRVTQADFTPNTSLYNTLSSMNYFHYKWPTPTGHPDRADYWLGTSTMLARWNFINGLLMDKNNKLVSYNFRAIMENNIDSMESFVQFWSMKILNKSKDVDFVKAMCSYLFQGKKFIDLSFDDLNKKSASLISILAMTPDFQLK